MLSSSCPHLFWRRFPSCQGSLDFGVPAAAGVTQPKARVRFCIPLAPSGTADASCVPLCLLPLLCIAPGGERLGHRVPRHPCRAQRFDLHRA